MIWIFFFFSFFINAAVQDNFKAAGILIYTTFQDNSYFVLGRDKWNREWSDFGGLREKNETVIQTACRECEEESGLSISLDQNSLFVFNKKTKYRMFLTFLDYFLITRHFQEYKPSNKKGEEKDQFILMPINLFNTVCTWCQLNNTYYVLSDETNYKMRLSFYTSIDMLRNNNKNLFGSQETSQKIIQLYPALDDNSDEGEIIEHFSYHHTHCSWRFYSKVMVISCVLMCFVRSVIQDILQPRLFF